MANSKEQQSLNHQAGLSLVARAPWALLVSVVVLLILLAIAYNQNALALARLVFPISAGVVCGLFMSAYWRGKGGVFFILGLLTPLVLIWFAELASFVALAQLIGGFFVGFFAQLSLFFMLKKPHHN